MSRRPPRGWEPYLVPYAAFLLLVELGRWLPEEIAAWVLPLRVAVPLALFLAYARRGRFPELRGHAFDPGGVAADLLFGLAVAGLWVLPYLTGLLPVPAGEGFDPEGLGPGLRGLALGLRVLGFALVVPFVEELFVRSFLIRAAELVSIAGLRLEIDRDRDFRDLPLARYSAWSFWVTVAYFTLSHLPWEYPVAFATGIAFNLWLYRRGHIVPVVIAHATANLAIFALVLAAAGRGADLWYLL